MKKFWAAGLVVLIIISVIVILNIDTGSQTNKILVPTLGKSVVINEAGNEVTINVPQNTKKIARCIDEECQSITERDVTLISIRDQSATFVPKVPGTYVPLTEELPEKTVKGENAMGIMGAPEMFYPYIGALAPFVT